MKTAYLFFTAAIVASLLNSCIPLAAGAAAGYVAHKEGYRVQSPVRKTDSPPPQADYDQNQY